LGATAANIYTTATENFRLDAGTTDARKITIDLAGTTGTLHGTWNLDSASLTSDKRMKEGIKPLFE
jgi:hypothetical protein